MKINESPDYFGVEKPSKILLKLAPPVMVAQLIQALYNIVDSIFVGRFSNAGLTALSIIYPLQLLMIALAVGTGVGINTVMASRLGVGKKENADRYAGTSMPIALCLWLMFALITWFIMPFYVDTQTNDPQIMQDAITYGRITCLFSFGLFLESGWSKVLQARGDMKTPTIAQIIGAIVNIILDPILIFGVFGWQGMGVAGAGVATVVGQIVAALVVLKKGYAKSPPLKNYAHYLKNVFKMGMPNMLMQSAYTLYIFGLNVILATFSDAAVTVLGLYYKWQTIIFIPISAMQTCIVPVISYNYSAGKIDRCKSTLNFSILSGIVLISIGVLAFLLIPEPLLKTFSSDPEVAKIGVTAFRIIGLSFFPLVCSLTYPVLFQAIGQSFKSSMLTIIRTVILFVPLAYAFSRFGLDYFWLTYPVTDSTTTIVGFILSVRFFKNPYGKAKTEIKESK